MLVWNSRADRETQKLTLSPPGGVGTNGPGSCELAIEQAASSTAAYMCAAAIYCGDAFVDTEAARLQIGHTARTHAFDSHRGARRAAVEVKISQIEAARDGVRCAARN